MCTIMKQEVSNNFILFAMGPIQDFSFLSKFYAFPFFPQISVHREWKQLGQSMEHVTI